MSNPRILIVEDSQLVSFHLKVVLEKAGYVITDTVKSGEEAIERVKNDKPDLVLMDIMLDGTLDGIDTSLLINKICLIPIIYLTALRDRNTIQRVKPTFPYSFLNKPFSEIELLTNVELALYRHEKDLVIVKSEQQLSSVIELINSSLILFDRDLKLVFINKSGQSLLQVDKKELLGQKMFKDITLKDYSTGENLNEEIIFYDLVDKNSDKLQKEFFTITLQNKSLPITELRIRKLNIEMSSGAKYMMMFNEASKELNKLEKIQEKEREMIKYLIEGQETERARISRELHDGLGQILNVVRMKMKETQCSSTLIDLINDAIHETSRISENLSPSTLRNFSLKSCVEDLSKSYRDLGIKVAFQTNIEDKDLEKEKFNIFRIIQEAVNNASKHAEADNIDIQLYKQEHKPHYTLTIEDDGKGFDQGKEKLASRKRKSHGLTNIEDRVKILVGQIEIESSKDLGTFISIKF